MGKVYENMAEFRKRAGMTQEDLGDKIGKHRSTIQGYENGSVDIPYSIVEKIAEALGLTMPELITGTKEPVRKQEAGRIKIYNLEDRLSVAQILIKNGYTVSQGKVKKTPDGRAMVYFLAFREEEGNADTSH